MADEVVKKEAPAEDPIKNLKAEMDRKIGNIEKTNQALLTQLQLIAQTPKREAEPVKKTALKDIWYDDPDAAAATITRRAKEETMTEIHAQNAIQAKKGNTIQQLYREYPELQDFDNPLTIKAVETFEKMTEEEKSNPIAYRLAVKEAAEDLDIKPKAKRKAKDDDDNFSLGSSKSESKAPRKREGLDPRTIQFAKLVGLDTDDEKVMTSLKTRSDRKNWMTWE